MRSLIFFAFIISLAFDCHAQSPKDTPANSEPSTYDRIALKLASTKDAIPDWIKAPELCSPDCPESMWFGNPKFLRHQSQELHVISFNEPAKAKVDANGRLLEAKTIVHIKSAEQPVVLLLASHHSINWKVEAAPDVTIAKIFLSSSEFSNVKAPANVPIQVLSQESGNFSRTDINDRKKGLPTGAQFLKLVQEKVGLQVTSYQGSVTARDSKIPVLLNPTWVAKVYDRLEQNNLSESANSAISSNKIKDARALALQAAHRSALSALIPPDIRQLVWCPVDQRYYMTSSRSFYTMDTNGTIEELQVSSEVEKPQWTGGVGYNAHLKRIYFVSTWHSGKHHAYDPLKKQWSVFPISGNSASSVLYLPKTQKLYGVTYPQVIEYDDQLKPLRIWDVSTSPVKQVPSSRFGSSTLDAMYLLVASGVNLMLLNESPRHNKDENGNTDTFPKSAILFNPVTLKIGVSSN